MNRIAYGRGIRSGESQSVIFNLFMRISFFIFQTALFEIVLLFFGGELCPNINPETNR